MKQFSAQASLLGSILAIMGLIISAATMLLSIGTNRVFFPAAIAPTRTVEVSLQVSPAPAIRLGGITDLDGYCRSIGYQEVSFDGGTISDIHCIDAQSGRHAINMTSACQWQYQRQEVEALALNPND